MSGRWLVVSVGAAVALCEGWGAPPLRADNVATPDAASPATIRLTADETVERARAASLRQVQLRALSDAAQADARVARARRLPSLETSAGYTRFSDVPEYAIQTPGAPPQVLYPNLPNAYRVRVGASVALYTGGRLGGLVDAADAQSRASELEVVTDEAALLLEARTAYWTLVTAREMGHVLEEALEAYGAHLRDARNRLDVGMAARDEVLAVEAARERARLELVRARNAVAVAEANLSRLLDLPVGTHVDPSEPLPAEAQPQEDIETLVAMAVERRPECLALTARLEAARAMVGVERAARLPQVSATAAWDYQDPNRRYFPPEYGWKDSWELGVAAQLSLFDGGKAAAATARARAQVAAVEAQLQDLRRRVRLEVTRLALDLEAAQVGVTVAAAGLDAARESHEVAVERYREGLIPSSELLDAEVALLRAGLDQTEALARTRLAAAGLDRAVGRER